MEVDFGGDGDAEEIAIMGKESEVETPNSEVEKTQKKEKKHKKDKKEKKSKETTARSPDEEPTEVVAPLQPCQEKKEEEKLEEAAGPPPDTQSTVSSEVSPETFAREETPKQEAEATSAELEQAAECAAVPARDNPSTVTLEETPKQAVEAEGVGLWQVVEAVVAALEAPLEATEGAMRVLEGESTSQDDGAAHADGSGDPQEPQEVMKVQDPTTDEVEPMGVPAAASLVQAEASPVLEGAVTTEATEATAHLEAPEHAEVPSAAMDVLEGASLIQAESAPVFEGAVRAEAAEAAADLEAPGHAEVPSAAMHMPEGAVLLEEIAKEEETATSPVLQGGAKVDETTTEEIELGAPELAEVASETAPLVEELSKLLGEGRIEGAVLLDEAVNHSSSPQEGSAEAWFKFGIPTEAALDAALRGEGLAPMEGISAYPEPLAVTPGLPQLDYDYDGACAPRPRPKPELQEPLPKRVKLEQPDLPEITGTPEEVRLLMEAAEPLKDEGQSLPYSIEILAPAPAASGENPSMIELYGEALLSSRTAPEPLTSTPPWRLCREARRHENHSSEPHSESPMTPYETTAYEAVAHGLAPDTPVQSYEVPGVMLPTPSEVASHEQVQSFLAAFQILANLDLPFADKLQVAWMVDNAKLGLVSVADYYDRCLKEVVAESGLTEQHLGTLGVPASVPRVPALPNYDTAWYVNNVYPSGRVKRSSLTFEEARVCVLASDLHIGSCQEPTQEGMRAVLQSMPPWYLLKSWVAARMNGASTASEDLFMGFRGKEAIKVLERNEVEPGMMKAVCASHRDYVETFLDACRITALELDALLERRLELDSAKVNEGWFKEKEDLLVQQHGWVRSHRLELAKSKRPDLYPGVVRELQEAKARGRALCLIPEEQSFSSWNSRPSRGRGGPYGRH